MEATISATGIPIVVPALASSGTVASSYLLYSWIPDSSGAPTASPRTLYTDAACTSAAANPATLGASVRKLYKKATEAAVIVIKSADGATTYDTINYPATLITTAEIEDTTLTALAALSFTSTNAFLRATDVDTFVAEAAAAHRTALSVPGLATSNTFTAQQNIVTSTYGVDLNLQCTDAGSAGVVFQCYHASASPANGDTIFGHKIYGNNSGAASVAYAQWDYVADVVTAASESGRARLYTYQSGTNAVRLQVGGGLYHPSATGGDKGNNTINFGAVYDDNVLLTDLVLDLAVDGRFDAVKYAAHPISKEAAAWWFDPDQYAEFWKAERRLPGMLQWSDQGQRPSTGESITRLTAVVEAQAVLIQNLNQRLKKLENGQ